MNEYKVKKLIVYPAGKWAKELLTLSRFEQIEYLVFDNEESCENFSDYSQGKDKVFSFDKLLEEDKNDILVIISDTRQYENCKEKLEKIGLIENIHFFNGWKLHKNFYRYSQRATNWVTYEKNSQLIHDDQIVWEMRAKEMAQMIPDDVNSIMDVGCGNRRLKKYLSSDIKYYGMDYLRQSEEVILCDFNREDLPNIVVDLYYMAGIVLYVNDIKKLFSQMINAKYILLSHADEMNYLRLDNNVGSLNSFVVNEREDYLTLADIINALWECGFVIEKVQYDYRERNNYYIRAKRKDLI